MDYGAIDLHKEQSEIRIVDAGGAVQWEGRIRTTRAALTAVWGDRPSMRILLESGTESEWVAQTLEARGHTVIVADPNYAPMYGTRTRRIKTDRRDVAALAEACRTGTYRPAHRRSAEACALGQSLRIRRRLVAARSGYISLLRSILRQEGLRLASGSAERILTRLTAVALPAALAARLAPLQTAIAETTVLITGADTGLHARASTDPVTQRLMTVPGVGPVVASTFQAVIDDPARFGGDARRVAAYLGLVPSEYSSAERQSKGAITKAGPSEPRALLVQASWVVWRSRHPGGAALRQWAHALAARRGRRVAVVALARRLSRILYAVWRDGTDFTAPTPRVAAA